MYNLTVKNDYIRDIGASNGVIVTQGKSFVFDNQGSLYLTIPGMNEINFIDLGDKKLEGYPEPTET
ncbi:hypothetical protein A8C32_06675 [Flavivirga aquatica]|uniref:Uncharacterized protein n=1 Tax=Flavivirga aquatica TaxID=1849968 RepID=A0A1E5SIB1_9FLAO|nr:hypothetical protein [Flavivirga aquatica]OEJ98867.1 hypothetical protein A8C32_06675 [Flavivirga aquatica]